MNYSFLPLIDHDLKDGTQKVLPNFIVSSKAKESLIYPELFAIQRVNSNFSKEGGDQQFYEFRYTLEGEGFLRYKGRNYSLKKGEGCIIDCRQEYFYRANSDNWESTCLRFNGKPADPMVQAYLQTGNVKFTDAMFSNFEPLQAHILQCTQKGSSYMEYEVSCTFYMLLTNLLIANSKARSTSEVIEKIVSYIQGNYMKNLTVDQLSHQFGLSRTHMTRCFKKYTGFAPHEYITQLRIYNAKFLLKATELSIEDISRETGFSDSVYFIQVFKKIEGMTPSKFRKLNI